MTGESSAAAASPAENEARTDKPKTRQFRRAFVSARPEPAMVARQMEVTALAFRVLGGTEPARRFLNESNDLLGGRPIDIAGSSAEGLQQVLEAMNTAPAPAPAAEAPVARVGG